MIGLVTLHNFLRRTTGVGVFDGPISLIVPFMVLAWQAVAPLIILAAYWKRKLALQQFIVAELAAYLLPVIALYAWLYHAGLTYSDLLRPLFP
jgi:hypothetical protein